MTIDDIKAILDDSIATLNAGEKMDYKEMLEKFRNSDDEGMNEWAFKIWDTIRTSGKLPLDFDLEDDIELANLLKITALKADNPWPLACAIIIMHNRYRLCDLLDKAFACQELFSILTCSTKLTYKLISEFVFDVAKDTFYTRYFDKSDLDMAASIADGMDILTSGDHNLTDATPRRFMFRLPQHNTLYFELLRSILPPLNWFSQEYPDYDNGGLSTKLLTALMEQAEKCSDRKPALPKLTAFTNYLNVHIAEMARKQ